MLTSFRNLLSRDNVKVAELRDEVARLNASIDLMSGLIDSSASSAGNTGNPYTTYSSKVQAMDRMYRAAADWGNVFAKNVVDVRAAFTMSGGVKPTLLKDSGTREMEFINDFMDFNSLDEEVPLDWAKEAEIEGKVLIELSTDTTKGTTAASGAMVRARFIPWTTTAYKVATKDNDYLRYTSVSMHESGKAPRTLQEAVFVYGRFGGRTHDVNDTPSKAANILKQMEDLDKALWDLRRINHIFAAPTPYFRTENADQAAQLATELRSVNWRLGKLLCTNAEFTMVGPATQGVDSLINEAKALTQFISGETGVPVQFLGLPDLLSNRSTADNMMEVVKASTSRERKIWKGLYEDLFRKVLGLANEELRGGFDDEVISVEIPFVTEAALQQISNVWLPLHTAGVLSLETLLGMIPDIDPKEELARNKKERVENMEAVLKPVRDAQQAANGDEGPPKEESPNNGTQRIRGAA